MNPLLSFYREEFRKRLITSKIVVIIGSKGIGKSEIIADCIDISHSDIAVFDGNSKKDQAKLKDPKSIFEGKKCILLKEAQVFQQLQNLIDICLELNTENLILHCSFPPNLDELFWEALKNQDAVLTVLPTTYEQCANYFGIKNEDKNLEQRLIYGNYASIILDESNRENQLIELVENTINHPLGAEDRVNKKEKLVKLLRHLAFRVGQVISFNELGKKCGLDNETVERYVQLFERANILFTLTSFFNNQRYELKKSTIVYFVDNGFRNALIRAFQPLEFRNDHEELWANWVISERRKRKMLNGEQMEAQFWMTHTKQHIEYIEQGKANFFAAKLSFDKTAKAKIPNSFVLYYPTMNVSVIHKGTFFNFITKK